MLNIPRWKVVLILLICAAGLFYMTPNLLRKETLDKLPSWFPKQVINLGLDLQGGSHLLLEVDTKAVVTDRYTALTDEIRSVMRKEKIGYLGLSAGEKGVRFKLREQDQAQRAKEALLNADHQLDVVLGAEGNILVAMNEDSLKERTRKAVDESIEIVRRRVDETGTKEPTIQRQGESKIVLQLPGIEDPSEVKKLLGTTAKLTFHLVDIEASVSEAMQGRIPPGSVLMPSEKVDEQGHPEHYFVIRKQVMLSGENLVDAQPGFGEYNQPVVNFKLDTLGARKFADITRENIGKPFAIVLDNKVISAPRINSVIPGGSGYIEGGFSVKEAHDFALLLRAGALPAPLTILEERTVGPDLGADSIKDGKFATAIAVIFIGAFMMLAYSFFGLVANIAMIFNLAFLIAAISVMQATLTLPGIIGIALTLGMAVDANVLIYERVKEELRLGRKPLSAIEAGFDRAMATITDSNLTTLIGALLMYQFGTGPIRGFAVTLGVGIIISMFTAISLSKLIIAYWFKWFKPKSLPI